jgi:nucleoside-diphosphate-sugar epimerase
MIYGNGLIASSLSKVFIDDDIFSIFAAGVSNSSEKRSIEFLREKEKLLRIMDLDKHLVYFSTCSIYDQTLLDDPYVSHKLEMESICKNASLYSIFRLPQVVGRTDNPNTLTNYLFNAISSNSNFKIWLKASRVLIDVDDVASIVAYMLGLRLVNNSTINISHSNSSSVIEIVEIFESLLGIKANYDLINKGASYAIECSVSTDVAKRLLIDFDERYTKRLIHKYYDPKLKT